MAIVGSADVRINADGRTFGPQLQGILSSQNNIVRQSGNQAGNEYGRGFSQGLSGSMRSAMQNAQREIGSGLNFKGMIDRPMAAEIGGGQAEAALDKKNRNLENKARSGGERTGNAFATSYGRALDSKLGKESINAAKAFQTLYARTATMAAGMGTAAGAVSTLVSGLGLIVGAAGSAASSLAAIGPALGAVLQGGVAVSVAFKGVGQAITAGMTQAATATKKSTGAAADNAKGILSAQRAIADARQRVADVVIQNAERMRNADEQVAKAVDDVKDSERDLLQAQKELTQAQLNLTAARKDAREELQQLAFSAEDAALAEERAGLNLEDAYAQLKAVQNLPADNKTRREAELSFKEAELSYREAKDRAQDLGDAQAEAAANGIKGTKAYQSAQKDVADAQDGVVKAQKDVAEAEKQLADARADRAKAAMQNARDLAKAQQAVTRAQEDLTSAQKGGAAAQAQTAQAVDKYAEALKKLSPSARAFVEYLVDNKNKFNDLKKVVQEPFFAKFTPAFKDFAENTLPDLSKKLADTSGIMGDFADQILDAMDIQLLGPIMDQNNKFLKKFSDTTGDGTSALQDLVTIFGQAYKAISPLTNRFGDFLVKVLDSKADFLNSKDGLKSLTDFFDRAGDRMSKFFNIFKSIVGIFRTIFKAAEKPIDDFMDFLVTSFDTINKDAASSAGAIGEHFKGVEKNLEPMLELVGQLGLMFLKLGSAPELGETFETLKGALPFIQQILDAASESGPVFAELVVQVAKLVAKFADDGGIKAFLQTLTDAAGFLNKVLDNEVVSNVLKIAGPILGAIHAVALLKTAFGQVGKVILGTFLKDTGMFFKGKKASEEYAAGWATGRGAHPPVNPVVVGGRGAPVDRPAAAAVPVGGVVAGGAGKAADNALDQTEKKSKGVFSRMGAGIFRVAGIFGIIAQAAMILIPIFTSLYAGNEKFKGAVDGLLTSLSGLFSSIVTALAPALKAIGDTFSKLFETIGPAVSDLISSVVTALAPIIQLLVGVFQQLMSAIAPVINMLVSTLVPVFAQIVGVIATTVLPILSQLIGMFIAGLMPVIKMVADVVVQLVGTFAQVFSQILSAVLPVIVTLVNMFISQLLPAIMALLPVVMQVFGAVIAVIQQLVPMVLPIIMQLVDIFVKTLIPVIMELAPLFTQIFGMVIGAVMQILPVLIPVINQIVSLFVDELMPAVLELIPVFMSLFKDIITTVSGLVAALLPMIMQIVALFVTTLLPAILGLLPVFLLVFKSIIGVILQLVPVLLPVIMQIVTLVVNMLIPAFMAIMPVIQLVIQTIIGVITQLLPVILPIIMTLIQVIVAILVPAFKLIMAVVVVVFKILVAVIQGAIPVINAILKVLVWVITNVLIPGIQLIVVVVGAMAKFFIAMIKAAFTAFQTIWNSVLKPAIQTVRDAINKISETAQSMRTNFEKTIKAAFKYFTDMYNTYVKPIFEAFKTGFDKLGEWAESARTAVGKGFSGLVDKIKGPIITALNWINTNLIDNINKVTSKFGLDIKHIPVPAKAEGGPVTGRGGPTEDNLPHLLSNGEFVMKTKSAKSIGYTALMHMNQTGEMPHLKPEGGWISDGWAKLSSAAKEYADKGIKSVIEGIWDKTIGPWASEMTKPSKSYMDQFIGGIVQALKGKVTDWATGRDEEADKLKKKYEAAQAAKGGGSPGVPAGDVNNPTGRVSAGNGQFTNLFAANLRAAEKKAGVKIAIYQAGFRPSTSYSGSTHNKDAIDLHVNNALIKALRSVKIAAGDRTGLGNWAAHVHAIPGPGAGYGSPSAQAQWRDYVRRGGAKQGYRSPWGLAAGGTVFAQEGGIHAIIGEGGRNERVEPLDRQGLSARDRALIQQIVSQMSNGQGGAGGATVVRVYIGNEELKDIVRYEVSDGQSTLAKAISTGRRTP